MRRKSLVLSAVAGLLVLGFAGPRTDLAIPAKRPARQHQDLDSVRTLPTRTNGMALPPAIDADKVIRQVRQVRELELSPALDSSPFTDPEFMPAPTIVSTPHPSDQHSSSVAFDGANYLVVWRDDRSGGGDLYGARVSQSGSLLDIGGIAISTAASVQDSPSVAFDGTNYLVVWQDLRSGDSTDIYGARISTAGTVLDTSGILVSAAGNDQRSPAVAFDGTNCLVVWQDYRSGDWDAYGARVSSAGAVLDPSGIAISTASDDQQQPSVAFDGTSYLVVWQDDRDNETDIYGARVSTAGVVQDPDGIAISTAPRFQWYPAVDFDGTNYLVVWADSRNVSGYPYWDVYGARVSQSGSVLDPGGIAVSTVTNSQNCPAVAFDGTNYLVVWQDNRDPDQNDIYGARVTMAGEVLDYPGGIVVGLDVNARTCQAWTAVAFDGTNYFVVWQDDRNANWDIYGARVSMAGEVLDYPDGIVVSRSVNSQARPAVAFDGINYLVVWADNRADDSSCYDVCGARVGATGTILDSAGFVISTNTPTSTQSDPAVAFDGTNYLVVWQDDRNEYSCDIYAARVSQSGSVLDPDGTAISTAARYQWCPSVAFDGTNYLVVWADSRNVSGYPYWDVYGARVSQSGSVLDLNGIAVSTVTNSQNYPAVAFDGTNYLVVWQDNRDNDQDDIYGARVTLAGEVLDYPEGIVVGRDVNRTQQTQAAVAFDGTNYLVVWADSRNANWDTYGARVTVAGEVLDSIAVSTATGNQLYPGVAFAGNNYLVVWQDDRNANADIYGCQVSPVGEVGEEYAISTGSNDQDYPVAAWGRTDGTAIVAYQSVTGVVGGIDYGNSTRIWGRLGILPMFGDVGTDSILSPVGALLASSRPIPPRALVRNHGRVDLGRFDVKFTVSPGSYSSTKPVPSLAAGDSCTIVFDSLTLTTGLFTARCSTMLAGDSVPDNNVRTAFFQGCTFINFSDETDGGLTPDPDTCWTRGVPQAPWTRPPNDTTAWGDRLSGYYGSNENSTLTSPIYEALQENPAIAFQHSFNTEASVDGGNFSYSTDSGSTWTVLTPCAGLAYNGSVHALGPDSGWSGWPSGWSQSAFTIPADSGDSFQVRWRFASDEWVTSCGWLIDEVAGIGCDTVYHTGTPQQPGGRVAAELGLRPNPTRGTGQLSYTLVRDCDVRIDLYDATGALAAHLADGTIKKGRHVVAMDVSRLDHGVYFLMLESAGDVKTTKVVIE